MNNLFMLAKFEQNTFCHSTANIWQFVGYFIFWFKIIIPLLIIILGVIDLGKAVVSSDDKEVKKAAGTLGKRVVIGVVIFFLPTIVYMLFGLVNIGHDKGAKECYECLFKPFKNDCNGAEVAGGEDA